MKWSKYNYFFETESVFLLYNSLTNSFAELEEETYKELVRMKELNQLPVDDAELEEQLVSMKVLVEDDRDEINRIKYQAQYRRFNNKHLGLTINPTLHCNFACPYCFEEGHAKVYMTNEVEDSLVQYIEKRKEVESLHVTWFGGEPLLAFDRIVSLTGKMRALGLRYNAGMITNGYLLTKNVIEQLPSLAIGSIQITLDGLAPVHNRRRRLVSGKGSFDRIMENIDRLRQLNSEIQLSIRVNIDAENKDDFVKIYDLFKQKNYPRTYVSPAFVDDISGCKVDDCVLFDPQSQARYLVEMKKKYGLDFSHFYPSFNRSECPVRNPNYLVIGPSGEIYKCWNDVGNSARIVGYLDEKKPANMKWLLRYLTGADPFEDEKCRSCLLLPVCSGGCPYSRLQNEYEGKSINTCGYFKDNMKEFLTLHYEKKLKEVSHG